MVTYRGSCHCGTVQLELRADAPIDALVLCDCSLCVKKGILHTPAEDDRLSILSGESALALYRFGSGTARHWFCRHCGIHTHGRPRNDPERYTVNARCLDDFERIVAGATIRHFDGKNHPKDRPA